MRKYEQKSRGKIIKGIQPLDGVGVHFLYTDSRLSSLALKLPQTTIQNGLYILRKALGKYNLHPVAFKATIESSSTPYNINGHINDSEDEWTVRPGINSPDVKQVKELCKIANIPYSVIMSEIKKNIKN